jgi:hypothetical protein
MKVSELTGAALDWAVAKCEQFVEDEFEPSENWADGGPIIEREKIGLKYTGAAMEFVAWVNGELSTVHDHYGPTPLIAAMRCYVASKMGDEIELPEEVK